MAVRYSLIAALLFASGAGAAHGGSVATGTVPAADVADPMHMTGAEPIDPVAYTRLPKMPRHRAWLPRAIDLSTDYPAPGTQGAQPNCVAWATTYAARSYILGKTLGRQPSFGESLSAAYIYNRLRPPGSICWGTVRMVDALDFLKTEGAVPFSAFPDDMMKCKVPADPALKAQAANFRIDDWRAIEREVPGDWRSPLVLDDVKGALARGVPVVFAMPTGPGFWNLKGNAVFDDPTSSGTGYHAMALVGYDEDRQAFRIVNSWGPRWGDGGYLWIGYTAFRALAGEAYALEAPVAKPSGPPPSAQQQLTTELQTFQCGSVALRQVGGHPVLEGYGGVQASLDKLRAAALAVSPAAEFRVAYHPWPQCEAEGTLAAQLQTAGVALAVTQEDGSARAGDPVAMREGDRFGVSASATAAKPYLSIVYLQADGSAVELYRGQPAPDAQGRRTVLLGTSGPTATRFEVGTPYGSESIIALASAQPLFGPELKTYATERQFLTGLRAHLLAVPAGSVSAAVQRLKTSG